jgi:hypothetical protein
MNRVPLKSSRLPGSRSAANLPATKSKTTQLQKVIQLQFGTVNWEAMNTYNSGSAGAAVSDAFVKANYTIDEIPNLVVRLINNSDHGKSRFGHMSGKDHGDGQQGDTTAKIESCKTYLINWAGQNPKGEGSIPKSTGTKHTEEQQKEIAKNKSEKKKQKKQERMQEFKKQNPYGKQKK